MIWESSTRPKHGLRVLVGDIEVTQDQYVHFGSQVTGYGIPRPVHDGLLPVEAGVEDNRDAGELGVFLDDGVVARVVFAINGLEAACAIDMNGSGDKVDLVGTNLRRHRHEGVRLVHLEVTVPPLV